MSATCVSRLKLKQTPTDVWSTKERLCLASSVMRSGDQNWVSVSRAIRTFGEPNRPSDWFSQKNCALQYSDLLEKVETPKRKRGERGDIETPGVSIVRNLTAERVEELKIICRQEKQRHLNLQAEIELIQSGQLDLKLKELWEQILEKKKQEEQRMVENKKWLQDREASRQASLAQGKTKSTKIPRPPQQGRRNSSQSEQGSEPEESTTDLPANETPAAEPPSDDAPQETDATVATSVSPSSKAAPSASPLLTSLLKSPTSSSILHSAITLSKETGVTPTSSSAISSLLLSSPSKGNASLAWPSPIASGGEAEALVKPATISPSAGAPTLSRLLEMPLVSPGKPLPPLPVVSSEVQPSETTSVEDDSQIKPSAADLPDAKPVAALEDVDAAASLAVGADDHVKEVAAVAASQEDVTPATPPPDKSAAIEESAETESPTKSSPEAEVLEHLIDTVTSSELFMPSTSTTAPAAEVEIEIVKEVEVVDVSREDSMENTKAELVPVAESEQNSMQDDVCVLSEQEVVCTSEVKEENLISVTEETTEEVVIIHETVFMPQEEVAVEVACEEVTIGPEETVPEVVSTASAEAEEPKPAEEPEPAKEPEPPKEAAKEVEAVQTTRKREPSDRRMSGTNENKSKDAKKSGEEKPEKVAEEPRIKSEPKEPRTKSEAKEPRTKSEPKEPRVKTEAKEPKMEKPEGKKREKSKPRDEKEDESRRKRKEPPAKVKKEEVRESRKRKRSREDSAQETKDETPKPPKTEETPHREPIKSARRTKEKEDVATVSSEVDEDSKTSEKDELSTPSRLFPPDSFPNSPASLAHSDDQESLRDYKVWKKAIMLVWRSAANHKFANVFLHPVTEEVAPGYHSVVCRPMDLSQIKKNIENGIIKTTAEFQRDMMLMFQNAIMYNSSDHDVFHMAVEMQKEVMRHIQDFLATQLMVQTAEIPKTLRRETRELTQKRSSESHTEKLLEEGFRRAHVETEGSKQKKRKTKNADD